MIHPLESIYRKTLNNGDNVPNPHCTMKHIQELLDTQTINQDSIYKTGYSCITLMCLQY